MSIIALPFSKRYDPAGRCIYCGRPGEETSLSDEHIIPFAINGELVLPKASCAECAKAINRDFECAFLSAAVIDARAHMGMKSRSRRRSKQPSPAERPGQLMRVDLDGNFIGWQTVNRIEQPFVHLSVRFKPPTLLLGQAARSTFHLTAIKAHFSEDFPAKAKKIQGRWGIGQKFSPDGFCREIAKIAHGAATAELGSESFHPFLPKIILGEDPMISHYIGGTITHDSPTKITHTISLAWSANLLLAKVRLFACLGTPSYLAVVGQK